MERIPFVVSIVKDKQANFLFASDFGRRQCLQRNQRVDESQERMTLTGSLFDPGATPWGSVDCALRLLDAVDCIAVAESLDDLLVQWEWRTGWLGWSARADNRGVAHFPHANHIIKELKSNMTAGARAIIDDEAAQGIDIWLYRRAVDLSAARTAEATRCLSTDSPVERA